MVSGTDAGVSPGAELGHPYLCIWMGSWKDLYKAKDGLRC